MIEGCRTFEEDDDNLPSLGKSIFIGSFQHLSFISSNDYYTSMSKLCLCFQTLLDRFRLLVVLCSELNVLFGNPWHLVWSKSMFVYMPSHKTDFTIITMEHMI